MVKSDPISFRKRLSHLRSSIFKKTTSQNSFHMTPYRTFLNLIIKILMFASLWGRSSAAYLRPDGNNRLLTPNLNGEFSNQTLYPLSNFTFSIPHGLFTDSGSMNYSTSLTNGEALPSWISFNSTTQTFNGTAPGHANLEITVNASDKTGFVTTVVNVSVPNYPPVNNISTQYNLVCNKSFTLTFNVTDPNNDSITDTLTFSNGTALPSWMTYNPSTFTLTGTSNNTETYTLMLNSSDSTNFTVTNFSITFYPILTLGDSIGYRQIYVSSSVYSWAIPETAFSGSSLTYSATLANGSVLPSWLAINNTAGSFLVYRHLNNEEAIKITLTANDPANQTESQTFTMLTRNFVANQTLVANDFSLNDPNSYTQSLTSAMILPNGNVMTLWESYLQDGSQYGVFAKILNNQGFNITPVFQVNTWTNASQSYPVMTVDSNGSIITAWQSEYQDGSVWGVYGQVWDLNGNKIGTEYRINTYTLNSQSEVQTAAFPNQYVIYVWQSFGEDGSKWGVYGKILNQTGYEVKPEFRINDYTNNSQQLPQVTILPNSNALVTWNSYLEDGSGWGVYGKIITPTGATVAGEFRINSYTTGNQENAITTILKNGNVFIAWESQGQDGSLGGIFGKIIDVNNNLIVPEFQINQYWQNDQTNVITQILPNGNIFCVWQSQRQPGNNYGIFGIILNQTGGVVRSEFQINNYWLSNQQYPQMAVLSNNYTFIAWESLNEDGSYWGIFAKVLDMSGYTVVQEFCVPDVTLGWQIGVKLVPLANGSIFVGWTTDLGGLNFDAYAKIYNFQFDYCPDILSTIPNQIVFTNETFNYTIPTGTFVDYYTNTTSVVVTQANGQPLPSWLTYNATNQTFFGSPNSEEAGLYNIEVKVLDSLYSNATENFALNVIAPPGSGPSSSSGGSGGGGGSNMMMIIIVVAVAAFIGLCAIYFMIRNRRKTQKVTPAPPKQEKSLKKIQVSQVNIGKSPRDNSLSKLQTNRFERIKVDTIEKVPEHYVCPVSNQLMSEPQNVVTEEGERLGPIEKSAINKLKARPVQISPNAEMQQNIETYLMKVTTQQLRMDQSLLKQTGDWIEKRGRENLKGDETLRPIVERYDKVMMSRPTNVLNL